MTRHSIIRFSFTVVIAAALTACAAKQAAIEQHGGMREVMREGNSQPRIALNSINATVEADLDPSGVAGADVNPRIRAFRVTMNVDGPTAEEAEMMGLPYSPSLTAPYRWQDWAAPDGAKRKELQETVVQITLVAGPRNQSIPYIPIRCTNTPATPLPGCTPLSALCPKNSRP